MSTVDAEELIAEFIADKVNLGIIAIFDKDDIGFFLSDLMNDFKKQVSKLDRNNLSEELMILFCDYSLETNLDSEVIVEKVAEKLDMTEKSKLEN